MFVDCMFSQQLSRYCYKNRPDELSIRGSSDFYETAKNNSIPLQTTNVGYKV